MTLGNIQNDYFDYVRRVWDIFGTIRPLKIIFWDYIFENFLMKMNNNTFFSLYATFVSLETKSLDAYGQSIWKL